MVVVVSAYECASAVYFLTIIMILFVLKEGRKEGWEEEVGESKSQKSHRRSNHRRAVSSFK